MALNQKYKKITLSIDNYELPKYREPGERVVKIGEIHIDRSVFKHDPGEKQLLKELKLELKRKLFAGK